MGRTKTYDLTTSKVDINDLRPHPLNPRNGDTDAIAESIDTNKLYKPIVIAKDGTILVGNHTYAAAMELGFDQLDVIRLPIGPNTAEARRIMVADNRTADLGGYDRALLLEILVPMHESELGLVGTGYDEQALTMLAEEQARHGGPIPNPDERPRWRLGSHVLVCDDGHDVDCPVLVGLAEQLELTPERLS